MTVATKSFAVLCLFAAAYACGSSGSAAPKDTARSTAASGSDGTFRFTVYGDTRDGHDVHRRIVALMMKQNPSVVVQTGDLVHNGANEALWKIYDDITGEMRKKVVFLPAMGNHEAGAEEFKKRVTAPITSGTKLYYSIDEGGCHFICLDIDELAKYDHSSDQYKWFVNDLKETQGKAKHIFVFFHVPPYSIGYHGSDLDVRKTFCPLFKQYHVQAVFTGHDHNYYRTVRDGITYIVTGGGGAPLYPCIPSKGALKDDVYESVHHFVAFELKNDVLTGTTYREDGSVIEHFTVDPAK